MNLDECTSCTACYQPDVCPVGAIYSEEHVPDGSTRTEYNKADPNKGHDHTFFIDHSRAVFADEDDGRPDAIASSSSGRSLTMGVARRRTA